MLDTLHVEHAEFETPPHYVKLNGRQLQTLLDDLWLDNEFVELKAVQVDSASFEGLLEFEGTLNGLNVEYIGRNYFSRTRSQRLKVPFRFEHDVTFAQTLSAKRVQLRVKDGALVEGIGNVSLNFDDFVSSTLKTAGVHTITGHWSIPEAHVPGDLSNVLINQLNFVDDVLHNDTKGITTIDAPKTAERAIIKRIFATPSSTVAHVPVAQWINNTVYVYGNHSIAGTTILETLNLYNDLRVEGAVNGIHWHSDQLLLCNKDQPLAGSLLVENTLPQQQRILSSNIEELWVDRINGLNVNELLQNKAHNRPNLHVASQLIFTQPLSVANFEPTEGNKWKRGVSQNSLEDWQLMGEHVAAVEQRLAESTYILNGFALLQQLPIRNVTELKMHHDEDSNLDILVVCHADKQGAQQIDRYVWQSQAQIFNTSLSKQLIPHEKSGETRFAALVGNATFVSPLRLRSLDCLALQNNTKELEIYCPDNETINSTIKRQAIIPTGHVKQLLSTAKDNGSSVIILLGVNAVELWQSSDDINYKLQQRLHLVANQIALAEYENRIYLAILTASPAATIHIYSADRFNSSMQLEQIFDLDDSSNSERQLVFVLIQKSNDLLLCVSNASSEQSLRIYQQQGVAGFQQILGESTLPAAKFISALESKLLALVSADGIFLVEPQFTRL